MTSWTICIACGLVGYFVHDESTSRAAFILLAALGIVADHIINTIKEERTGIVNAIQEERYE